MKVAIFRKAHFNAAHRVHNPNWSLEKNQDTFGKCNNPHYHGHNYELIVKVVGEVDPETGYVIDLDILKNIIKEKVEDRFDHKNLNLDTEEFKDVIPSTENFAIAIYNIMSQELGSEYQVQIKLYETPRNFVEYPVHLS